MSRITRLAVTCLATLFALPVYSECVTPNKIGAPPNGATSTEEQMVEGQQAVKAWLAEMEKHLACLETERSALGEEITEEQDSANTQMYNAAVDSMNEVANRFNEEIRAYQAANN